MKLWVYARLMSLLMLADIINTDLRPTTVTIVSVAIYSAMLKHFAPFQICKEQALDRPVFAHMHVFVLKTDNNNTKLLTVIAFQWYVFCTLIFCT